MPRVEQEVAVIACTFGLTVRPVVHSGKTEENQKEPKAVQLKQLGKVIHAQPVEPNPRINKGLQWEHVI